MRTVNLVLCILNVLCLIFNIYRQDYLVAAVNWITIFFCMYRFN